MLKLAKKKVRKANIASLIVVGEGIHDRAFLNHMKDNYDGRKTGQVVKIESSDGGSPRNILMSAKKSQEAAYDKRYVLMDSDVAIQQQDWAYAEKHKIEVILSTPVCLEGMLLDVLGVKPGTCGDSCKTKLKPFLGGCPTQKTSYQKSFSKEVLDTTEKDAIVSLRELISNQK
ncbi:conserved protein of unknown function [Vibrio tapetis subsp. tapetis]|uniref:RloB domain-containing protein n=1 Tax=Vibrio tapetis subsp. tapetis TaxID=1671868 RepID=A0A2N8ZI26_9VIBR|nr:conserved protein of unknown function [Vibrio tapetis subsp. tapetis]